MLPIKSGGGIKLSLPFQVDVILLNGDSLVQHSDVI